MATEPANAPEILTPEGFVYFARNRFMPNILKIGMTRRSPYARLAELKSTGVVGEFELVGAYFVIDCEKCEKYLHDKYNYRRIDPNREFFEVPDESHYSFVVECGYHLISFRMIDERIYFGMLAPTKGLRDNHLLEAEIERLNAKIREKDLYIRQALHNVK